tara:strand:- start:198 stop:569 length:372 start_codon:yes stop_codon:yes gene_type:complete
MGNFVSLVIDVTSSSAPTPTPSVMPSGTPSPTAQVTSRIQEIVSGLMEEERNELLEQAQNFDPSVPLPTTSVTDELLNVYEDNIETFVGDISYLKNTRTNKMSQGIFNRNTDSVVLGPNTFSK